MIGISSTVYDLYGAWCFKSSELDLSSMVANYRRERRITRTPTLDGGMSVYDTGYTVADRDMTVKVIKASKEIADWMAYMVEVYNEIIITTDESAFRGNPARFYMDTDSSAVMIINLTEDIGG